MNEYETNPQRHEASSSEEPSHRPADTSRDSGSPERGQSDTSAYPATGAPYQAPPAPAYQPSPWQAAQHGQPQPGQPQPGQPQPGQPQPGQPQPGQPQPGQPQPGQPYQPAYPGQHPYPGQQYPAQGQPAAQSPYERPGAYPGQAQQTYAGHDAYNTWRAGGVPPHGDGTAGPGMPVWAQPVGAGQPGHPAVVGRGRKTLMVGAAAVLLALGSGGIGAYSALAFSTDAPIVTTKAGNSSVTRVVDRSSLAQIAAAVKNSVVSITTGSGEGSGVIMSADGYVLTNNHVVASAQSDTVKVVFADGKSATAKVIGTDPRTDLAVVKADGVSGLKAAQFGKSANMQVGDTVLALGSPLGLEGSVTAGIISAKDRTIRSGGEDQQDPNPFGGQQQQQQQSGTTSMSGLLQTDAPINPGNSGGALVNTAGEVIGINSAIATSGQNSGNIGLGFAIPSDKATVVANQLMKGEKVSHPALGVSVAGAEGGGAVISTITPNSAAAKAGLKQGDVINEVNGKAINDSDELVAIVQGGKVGDTLQITFTRNGAKKTAAATLTEAA